MNSTSRVSWHDGGEGNCQTCGAHSLALATFSRDDRVMRLFLCDNCAQKVRDDIDGMFVKAMKMLDR